MAERIINNSHTLVEGMLFNPADLYSKITEIIKDKEVKGIMTRVIRKKTNGFFSSSRDYLEVSYGEFTFLFGASPFGRNTMFVSWWLTETPKGKLSLPGFLGGMVNRIVEPFSMYKSDEMSAFLTLTKSVASDALAEITKGQSVRILSEAGSAVENK